VVQTKLVAKQKLLDDARQALLGTDNPDDHRKIVAGTRQKLTSIDETAGAETRTYQGHTYAKQPDGSWKLQ